jgi:GalNAc-alpha-(1->4)-GalNAc-alpha-(1->3)-diNAcBac-PP-undecaprenol alpha-1,4-N-acetyl-D-galactosaminyltransferase
MIGSSRRMTLVIHSLSSGGAERVCSILANAWAERGWQVTLVTFTRAEQPPFYRLHPAVVHRPLGIARVTPGLGGRAGNLFRRVRTLRRALRASAPDVVVSFMNNTNVQVVAAAFGSGVPVVVAEHSDPAQHDIGPLWSRLRSLAYPHAARVVVLNQRVLETFSTAIQRRSRVIPNPVLEASPRSRADEPPRASSKTLITLGRFSPEKGFDLLLDAFAQVAARHPDWRLVIWGEGPLRASLEEQRNRLGLTHRVCLPGLTTEPYGELQRADLYVLPSRYECFPMGLCEAMACGLPVVGFDCRTGPREIIEHGVDGILVPAGDVTALASALDRLMGDPDERARLASRAPAVTDRFGLPRVLALWDELFEQIGVVAVGGRP